MKEVPLKLCAPDLTRKGTRGTVLAKHFTIYSKNNEADKLSWFQHTLLRVQVFYSGLSSLVFVKVGFISERHFGSTGNNRKSEVEK